MSYSHWLDIYYLCLDIYLFIHLLSVLMVYHCLMLFCVTPLGFVFED